MSYVDDNRAWLEPYVTDLAGRMGLPHWTIILSDDEPNDGCDATTSIHSTYLRAFLMLRDPADWEGVIDVSDELRATITHELIHLHVHDWDQTIRTLEDHINPPTWHLMEQMLFRSMERSVDAVARAWARTLPLPEIPEEREEAA